MCVGGGGAMLCILYSIYSYLKVDTIRGNTDIIKDPIQFIQAKKHNITGLHIMYSSNKLSTHPDLTCVRVWS